MRFEKIKSFWISANFHGAMTKTTVDKTLYQVEDFENIAS